MAWNCSSHCCAVEEPFPQIWGSPWPLMHSRPCDQVDSQGGVPRPCPDKLIIVQVCLWTGYIQTARQNRTRQSQMKKPLVLSGFLDQKFAGNLKEVAQIVPDNTKTSLCLPKRHNLVLSGTIWPTCFKFPANFWSRKPDRTSHFLVLLRLGQFCLACLALV